MLRIRVLTPAVVLVAAVLALGVSPSRAAAQATLLTGLGGPTGHGPNVLPANDDGSSAVISLAAAFPAGLRFFGATHTNIYVNNNGNVTFAGPVGAFTPVAFPVASQPMIAPWWGDVDTRGAVGGGQNLVYWSVTPGRFVATWYNVGYYNSHTNLLNAFQVILTDASAVGAAGDFDVEFRYNRCQWTTGDASGGVGGLGGTPAQAGFDAGNGVDYYELPGSRTAAILTYCTTSNVGMTGVWRFQIRSGSVGVCGNGIREAGEGCDDGNRVNGDGCNQFCEVELPPGSTCTLDTDCRSGFCTDGVCCNERCFGQCERCNRPGALGTCGPQSGAPFGSRAACTGTGTTCGGSCNGVLRAACVYPGASTSCDDGAFCTVGDSCSGGGACVAGPPRVCDDSLSCTTDACDEVGDRCTATLASGCLIASMCVPAGAVDPGNQCRACQPAISTTAYTPRAAGTSCDDGAFCTVGDACDGAGACGGAARSCDDGLACTTDVCDESADTCTSTIGASCIIGGACVAAGTLDPTNDCMACQPAISASDYTPLAAGTTCDDGMFCTDGDACDGAGACTGPARDCDDAIACTTDACDEAADACTHVVGATCLIGGACVPDGARDPANDCLACQPAIDTGAYTPLAADTACDDGAFCTDGDVCDGAGACAGTARDCGDGLDCTDDACDESAGACTNVLTAGCAIDGACVAEGATDPADPCRRCDSAVATDAWTPWPDGPGCADAGVPDAGPPDAGPPDAGPPPEDASVGMDAMPEWEVRGSGACSASGGSRGGAPLAISLLLALGTALAARRRGRREGGR